MRRPLVPLFVLLLLIGLGLGLFLVARRDAPPRRPNVVLIVVDTLRADRLGCYGNERGLTPHLDALAARGRRFEAAFAHAPWTLPSMASLLTGALPVQHGAGGSLPQRDGLGGLTGGFRGLDAGIRTLAECFDSAGYATHAVVNVDFLTEKFGLTRGFDSVDAEAFASNLEVRTAGETTAAALEWLDTGRERDDESPVLLLVHYFDPHAVYAPPSAYRRKFAAPEDQKNPAFRFGTREQMLALRSGRLPLDPPVIERAAKLYDGEIAYVDAEIGRLLAGLAERDLESDTIVAFTSDHGEEFLDHGGFEHGHTLYAELLHVPLLLAWPGRMAPGTDGEPVGLVDLGPTLCELADIGGSATFAGRSLVPRLQGSEPPSAEPRALLAHGNFWGAPLASLRDREYQVILAPDGQGGRRAELYRWREDPAERRELSAAEPERAARLQEALEEAEAVLEKLRGRAVELGPVELDPAERERLRALGYIPGREE